MIQYFPFFEHSAFGKNSIVRLYDSVANFQSIKLVGLGLCKNEAFFSTTWRVEICALVFMFAAQHMPETPTWSDWYTRKKGREEKSWARCLDDNQSNIVNSSNKTKWNGASNHLSFHEEIRGERNIKTYKDLCIRITAETKPSAQDNLAFYRSGVAKLILFNCWTCLCALQKLHVKMTVIIISSLS